MDWTPHLWFLEGPAIVREKEELRDDLSLLLRKPRPGKAARVVQDIFTEVGELFIAVPILKSLEIQRGVSLDRGSHGEMQRESVATASAGHGMKIMAPGPANISKPAAACARMSRAPVLSDRPVRRVWPANERASSADCGPAPLH